MENRVYNELLKHKGAENAILARDLADKVGLADTREVRHFVHRIRASNAYEKVVLSGNKGYYIGNEKEVKKCIKRLLGQAFNTLKISRAVQKKASLDGQGIMKGEEIEFVESLIKEYKEDIA